MNEVVWLATWFCLAMHDQTCARLEGSVGSMKWDNKAACEVYCRHAAHVFRMQLHIPLAYVCWEVGEVYKPLLRPKGLVDKGRDRGLPWPETRYTPVLR